jgi:hypothetical protein
VSRILQLVVCPVCPQEPKDKSLKSKTNMNHKEEVKDQRPKPKEKRPEPKVEIKCQILKIKDQPPLSAR